MLSKNVTNRFSQLSAGREIHVHYPVYINALDTASRSTEIWSLMTCLTKFLNPKPRVKLPPTGVAGNFVEGGYFSAEKFTVSKMFSPAFLIVVSLLCGAFVTEVASQDSSDGEQRVVCLGIPKATMSKIQCGMSAIQMAMKII
ncbi:hypothetical protein AVEN_53069-1 [Araneus ventricosus]|uniref:Uncharacterized protein n=1 Tax=Araneus ventricosus TaxID=182803 RepID=A0A4Y2PTT2_ARAVE|nr:hypothetical protein AVEN_53069-1 [Araneus ventricosus]